MKMKSKGDKSCKGNPKKDRLRPVSSGKGKKGGKK
jgi:hypothetical protein